MLDQVPWNREIIFTNWIKFSSSDIRMLCSMVRCRSEQKNRNLCKRILNGLRLQLVSELGRILTCKKNPKNNAF